MSGRDIVAARFSFWTRLNLSRGLRSLDYRNKENHG